jgi:proliferating cell nuclear antigen PCNA
MDVQLFSSLTSGKPEIFTTIFQHIRLFTENVSLIFSPTGLYFQTMDSSRVSIVELTLPNTWFDKYTFTSKTDIVLGIPTAILFKILNAREKQQRIQFLYDNSDALAIHFTSDDTSIFDKHFECPLMDLETDIMNIPEIEYSAEFTLPSAIFSTLIQQLKTFGDTLDIECTEEHIQLAAKSSESGTMSVQVNIDDLNSFSINEGEQLHMSFSLIQLHQICMFNKVAKELMVSLCKEYPLSIIYPITDDETTHLKLFLAPKIKDD